MAEQIYAEVTGSADGVVTSLDRLKTKLETMQSAFADAAKGAAAFQTGLSGIKTTQTDLSGLGRSLNNIAKAADNLSKHSGTLQASLTSVTTAVNGMSPVSQSSIENLKSMSDSFRKLGTSMKNIVTYSKDISASLNQIVVAANGLPALNANAKLIFQSLSNIRPAADKVATSLSRVNTASKSAGGGFMYMFNMAKRYLFTGLLIRAFSMVSQFVTQSINKSMEYIENINYFNQAYGEMSEKAGAFYQNISDVLGIDMGIMVQNGAMFEAMAKSLGASSDAAYALSTNLMKVGIDLASLTGKGLEETWNALQSGVIAGQYKPLAKGFGINVTESALEQTALRLGIQKTVEAMTPLEKAYLRYKTVLYSAQIAQGDMARTLESPANATRVFQSAVEGLSRSLGSIVIPMLVRVLPYVTAFVKILGEGFNALAAIFGFEAVNFENVFNNVDFAGAFDDVGDGADGANAKVEELKKNIMGFDEFNILQENKSGGSGGSGLTGGGSFDMDWGDYDLMLDTAMNSKLATVTEEMRKALSPLGEAMGKLYEQVVLLLPELGTFWETYIKPIGLWVLGTGLPALVSVLTSLLKLMNDNPDATLGIGAITTAIILLNTKLVGLAGVGKVTIAIALAVTGGIEIAEWLTGGSLEDSIKAMLGAKETKTVNVASFFNWVFDPRAVSETLGENTYVGWAEGIKADIIEAFSGVDLGYGVDQFWKGVGLKMEAGIALIAANVKLWWTRDVLNAIIGQFNQTIENLNFLGIDAELFKIPPIDVTGLEESAKKAQEACELVDASLREVGSGGTHYEAIPEETVKAYGGMPTEVALKMEEYKSTVKSKAEEAGNILSSTTNTYKGHTVAVYGGMPAEVAQKLADYKNRVSAGATDAGNTLSYTTGVYKGHTVGVYDALSAETQAKMGVYSNYAKIGGQDAGNYLADGTKVGTANAQEFVRKYVNKTGEYLAANANNTIDSVSKQQSTFAGIPYAIQQKLGLVWGAWSAPAKISFPALAQGAFMKANTPQLAIVGDNKTEGEFVAPESKLLAAVIQGVRMSGMAGVPSRVNYSANAYSVPSPKVANRESYDYETIYRATRDAINDAKPRTSDTYLDGEKISTAVVNRINRDSNRTGRSPILAGG